MGECGWQLSLHIYFSALMVPKSIGYAQAVGLHMREEIGIIVQLSRNPSRTAVRASLVGNAVASIA